MYSSNGFNVCPHCGKPNALNARFCSSCGKQLTVPDEIVVCPKCHKTNSPMASFCGQCGAPLKESAPTKICPRCGKSIDVSQSVCSCGYSFGVVANEQQTGATKKQRPYKGGRVLAVVALVFVLVFAYFIAAPVQARPSFLWQFDKGIVDNPYYSSIHPNYGYDVVLECVQAILMQELPNLVEAYGVGGVSLFAMCAVTMLCLCVHLLVCIVRIFTGKRSAHRNGFYLFLAIVFTLWTALWAMCYYLIPADSAPWLLAVRNVFVPKAPTGYVMFAMPLYFWFFYVYSACAKVHKIKEKMA